MDVQTAASVQAGLEAVAAAARTAGVFGEVTVRPGMVCCAAAHSADPAEYRVTVEKGEVWVSLVTAARYLSQSIEQTLVHSGDKAGDLLRDELIDAGLLNSHGDPMPLVEHFRSPPPEKLYTFRTPLAGGDVGLAHADGQETALKTLLAYRAAFDELGGMAGE
ncbi:MAG: hypothetical protein K2Q09_01330 [Phycisphaerales bacterium]|nr:hypothetical protein [Phycisphaerales bacterium]